MNEYGKRKKKYVFYDLDDVHARLIVRMLEDGLNGAKLMREFLRAYIEYQPDIMKWVHENPGFKVSARTQRARKLQKKRIALQENDLNLEEKDIQEIFDILADQMEE